METLRILPILLTIFITTSGAYGRKTDCQTSSTTFTVNRLVVAGQIRLYLGVDITDGIQGDNYICEPSTSVCTAILTDSASIKNDANGKYVLQNSAGVTYVNGIFSEL